MRFSFADTHAYPGCRVRLGEEEIAAEVIAEFSDGTVVPVVRRHMPQGLHLAVPAYTTRKGSRIKAREWLLRAAEGEHGWRVARPPSGP